MNIKLTEAQKSVVELEEWTNADIWGEGDEAEVRDWFDFVEAYDADAATLHFSSPDMAMNALSFITDRINAMDADPYQNWHHQIRSLNGLTNKIVKAAA